jgi:hypothetical protein
MNFLQQSVGKLGIRLLERSLTDEDFVSIAASS